ncbi:MAG: 3-hydroxybutyryl-CoA dehydrogenase [Thermoleophilaceae bacterium]|nr:3-hydroxybutyryl-CoA dehydrogenase [Thermoleophilaceae bacterium]
MSQPNLKERLGIAGCGAIAKGFARVAAGHGEVILWARRDDAAAEARAELGDSVTVTSDFDALAGCTYVVEAVVEDPVVKSDLLRRLAALVDGTAVIGTTTSSLSIEELAAASGHAERFAGIHVFNPVDKMPLVELVFPAAASEDTRARSAALCEALGKTCVEVPDTPGFVVNRLLFPLLFNAVRLMDEYALEPATVDACMKLGAGHPMGPLKLLDFVGLDVAASIGEQIGEEVPARVRSLIARGDLGRKSGRGFYSY